MKIKKFTLAGISLLALLGGMKTPIQNVQETNTVKIEREPKFKQTSTNHGVYTGTLGTNYVTVAEGTLKFPQPFYGTDGQVNIVEITSQPSETNPAYYFGVDLDSLYGSSVLAKHDYINFCVVDKNASWWIDEMLNPFVNVSGIKNEITDYYMLETNYETGEDYGSIGYPYVLSVPVSQIYGCDDLILYFYYHNITHGNYDYYIWLTDTKTLEDGQTAEIAVNVDDAPTIDEILAQVTAQDLIGGAVTVQCSETEKAKYKPNQLGTYTITITATDSYGQSATAYLKISVVDVTAPTIALASGKNLNFYVNDKLTFANIGSYFTITDNGTSKGGTLNSPTYTLDGSSLTSDYTFSKVGTHSLGVSVSDSSGNIANKTFTITVTDNVPPVITRKDGGTGTIIVGLSRVLNLSQADFLELFQATDAVDGDVSSSLAISGDFIPSKVGTYEITVIASDKSNNSSTLTVTVDVDADMPPVFILSDTLINATTSNPLTSSQIQQVIALAFYPDTGVTSADVLINDTEYQANSETSGNYVVTYSVTYTDSTTGEQINDSNKKLTIAVSDTGTAEENELSGWTKFWQCFKNWFRGVFTKFQFNCWITDAEWELRFPAE